MANSKPILSSILAAIALAALVSHAYAINVQVDYTYDTNNFFDTTAKRTAMQEAADRISRVIDSNLAAVGPSGTGTGTSAGWRIGFSHPGTGNLFQASTAASFASDPLSGAGMADVYGFSGLQADTWILYAGGRDLTSLGGAVAVGGTGTGVNFVSTFNDLNGPMHRGLIPNTPSNTAGDLPVWGGAVSFGSTVNWHFDTSTSAPFGAVDFYSIALHEISHALGLSLSFNQWEQFDTGGTFTGPQSVNAYNADNGTSLTELNQVSADNEHWEDGTYDSIIFAGGAPNYVGTAGAGNLQDLIMEPVANFSASIRRLELTNVDVAAFRDIGWSTIAVPEPSTVLFFAMIAAVVGTKHWLARH
ncbi:MAG: hypothetical protein AAGD11_00780 [Planctomycetota bacterium]